MMMCNSSEQYFTCIDDENYESVSFCSKSSLPRFFAPVFYSKYIVNVLLCGELATSVIECRENMYFDFQSLYLNN
jgi:hypothetical protein